MAPRQQTLAGNLDEHCTIIGAQIEVRGEIQGEGELRVFGAVEGSVELSGVLVVEGGALVRADVIATQVIIAGIVIGDVQSESTIVLKPSARVVGALNAPRIEIADGAQVRGGIQTAIPEGPSADELARARSMRGQSGRSVRGNVSGAAARAGAVASARASHDNRAPLRRPTGGGRSADDSESTAIVRHAEVGGDADEIDVKPSPAAESVSAKLPPRGKKRAQQRDTSN